jgi:hypothetical protein
MLIPQAPLVGAQTVTLREGTAWKEAMALTVDYATWHVKTFFHYVGPT